MSYKILITKEFSKDFKKLDKQFQDRIKKKVEEVAEDPARYKHLHYQKPSRSLLNSIMEPFCIFETMTRTRGSQMNMHSSKMACDKSEVYNSILVQSFLRCLWN